HHRAASDRRQVVVAGLDQGDRKIEREQHAIGERERGRQVQPELIADDGSDLLVRFRVVQDNRIVHVVEQHHRAKQRLAASVGTLHTERAITGWRRVEVIGVDAGDLGLWLRGDGSGYTEEGGGDTGQ